MGNNLEVCESYVSVGYAFFPTHALDVSDLDGRPDFERIQMSTKQPLILQRFRMVDENGADVWWLVILHQNGYLILINVQALPQP